MTESEAKGFVQGKLDCMKKCDIFNKEDNTRYNDCDSCDYCYSQGNFREQKEAFQMAINALEKQIDVDKAMKFIESYAFEDSKEIYTNGTILVPLFRVKQAIIDKAYNGLFEG